MRKKKRSFVLFYIARAGANACTNRRNVYQKANKPPAEWHFFSYFATAFHGNAYQRKA
jgi:hypothetical protein